MPNRRFCQVTAIQRAEPHKSLFEVPANYAVKDGPPEDEPIMIKRKAPVDEQP